ncbi:acyl-CoA dehydrogenase [Nonomuraea sp. NPDC050404]|uniref:acyl-CoA dehydrogenase n=1 Tax=Nonomuraea sp. NPDC050404 TaxID=3155783 RepID=UPI003402AAD1
MSMDPGDVPGWQKVAGQFVTAVESGLLDLPLPGAGRTGARWAALAALAQRDLSLARLCEGHTDAVAILTELAGPRPEPGSRWGVWAAQPPGPSLSARPTGAGWVLEGTKQYCSGARVCTHALVTADAPDGIRLFALPVAGLAPLPGSWPATGMAASDTLDVRFAAVPAEPVGPVGAYVERPGFHHGGAGVAACWYGGAKAVAATLLDAATQRDIGPHALAHLGAVDITLHNARAALERAAEEIDADPHDHKSAGRMRSLRLKSLVEAAASEVLSRVGRALGAGPLGHDGPHGRRVADLTVYLRQHHAERDLAALGSLVAEQGTRW